MKFQELIEKLNELVIDNNIKKALNLLKEHINKDSSKIITLRVLLSRYNALQKATNGGTISTNKTNKIRNIISKDVFTFVESLNKSDLDLEINYINREIVNPILIFTREENIQDIRNFFWGLNFSNITARSLSSTDYILDDYDLFIFDNQDIPFCNNQSSINSFDPKIQELINSRIQKMDAIIQSSKKFIIHFGEIFFWVRKNRNHTQAANSKFSLHARTKEVIDFINTYQI